MTEKRDSVTEKRDSATEGSDFATTAGEILRWEDVDRAERKPRMAGYEGQQMARQLLRGQVDAGEAQRLVDLLHARIGLRLEGVREHDEGRIVRLIADPDDPSTFLIQALNEGGNSATQVDAAQLVAWILSPAGRAALGRRGIDVDGMIDDAIAARMTT